MAVDKHNTSSHKHTNRQTVAGDLKNIVIRRKLVEMNLVDMENIGLDSSLRAFSLMLIFSSHFSWIYFRRIPCIEDSAICWFCLLFVDVLSNVCHSFLYNFFLFSSKHSMFSLFFRSSFKLEYDLFYKYNTVIFVQNTAIFTYI